jgi:hypothetical protein
MSDTLSDTVGATTVVTQLAPEGDRWISTATGGEHDGRMWAMDLTGDQAALHAVALEDVGR